jgi:diadenylate cyclase
VFDYPNLWNSVTLVGVRDLLDILVVYFIVYYLLKLVRGTQAVQIAFGMAVLALLSLLASRLQLRTAETLLREALVYSPLAIIVLFQGEIRAALTHLGKSLRNPIFLRNRASVPRDTFDEVVLAATTLASRKIGALIIYERMVGLQNFIDTGVKLDAVLTYDLIVTIFDPRTPLHDGAVILRNNRVAAASCFLPLTTNPRLSKELGTRHRAAIGITEDSDAVAVVVSEETGTISFVSGGVITRHLHSDSLREALRRAFEPPRPIVDVIPTPSKRPRWRGRRHSDPETTADMGSEVGEETLNAER